MHLPNDIDRALIITALAGDASEEELRDLNAWRARSPENEREYRRLAQTWLAAGEAQASPIDTHAPSADTIVALAQRRGEEGIDRARVARPRPSRATRSRVQWFRAAVGIAAAALVALGVGLWTRQIPGSSFGPDSLVTGANEVATVTLQDQTVVRLAPESRLTFGGGAIRQVSLVGRAYFAVAEDPRRPFRVRLPSGDIEVLGTRFDVESRGSATQVAVVEGSVRLSTHGARLDLEANDVATVTGTGVPEVRQVDDPYEVIGWLQGFLAFESTPLEQVVHEFNRRFVLQLEIVDDALRSRVLTGWFADQTPEQMVAGICTVVEARCELSGGVVRMMLGQPGVDVLDDTV